MEVQFFRLSGGIRHYAWGQRASDGLKPYIPSWLGLEPGDEPWAELWLGAHPSLPSIVELPEGGRPLDRLVAEDPCFWCGNSGGGLSFLLKLLSCSHPLSIQSHPDRVTAERLHALNPAAYPDPNDKTEIIIALEPFEAMAGFRNAVVAREDLERLNAFKAWVSGCMPEQGMRGLVNALFALQPEAIPAICHAAEKELAEQGGIRKLSPNEELFLRLGQACPGDRGTLFAFILNYLRLEPGEACFLPPNSPHAYLQGVGIECMTNSDNVIRAGLTPKAVDVPTMLDTLDFSRSGVTLMVPPAGECRRFAPPGALFQVLMIEDGTLELGQLPEQLMICMVLQGEAHFECGGQTLAGKAGSSWIRPAALKDGRIVCATAGTRLACAIAKEK